MWQEATGSLTQSTIDRQTVIVHVLASGIRKEGEQKDIYEVAKKPLNAGLLDLDPDRTP